MYVIVRNHRYTRTVLSKLVTAVLQYLHETLGLDVLETKPWVRVNELPYFLKDAFEFSQLALLRVPVVLAIPRAKSKQSLSEIRILLNKVMAITGQPVVYIVDALASYDRRRLIEQKVPFIVPGNQLYLPDLGIDLREYFRQRSPEAKAAFSPSTQAMLITALLHHPWQPEWEPSTVAAALGYTPMTLSRAVKELLATELVDAYSVGRSRWLRMRLLPAQIWARARPFLRSPIKRSVWVAADPIVAHRSDRIAGLSALAQHSLMTEPKWPTYAITTDNWKAATSAGIREMREPEAGAQNWQIWSYSPALVTGAPTVDPLSLWLSLQGSTDDRIQLALDEMKDQLPW